jgi:hypothetical protein
VTAIRSASVCRSVGQSVSTSELILAAGRPAGRLLRRRGAGGANGNTEQWLSDLISLSPRNYVRHNATFTNDTTQYAGAKFNLTIICTAFLRIPLMKL